MPDLLAVPANTPGPLVDFADAYQGAAAWADDRRGRPADAGSPDVAAAEAVDVFTGAVAAAAVAADAGYAGLAATTPALFALRGVLALAVAPDDSAAAADRPDWTAERSRVASHQRRLRAVAADEVAATVDPTMAAVVLVEQFIRSCHSHAAVVREQHWPQAGQAVDAGGQWERQPPPRSDVVAHRDACRGLSTVTAEAAQVTAAALLAVAAAAGLPDVAVPVGRLLWWAKVGVRRFIDCRDPAADDDPYHFFGRAELDGWHDDAGDPLWQLRAAADYHRAAAARPPAAPTITTPSPSRRTLPGPAVTPATVVVADTTPAAVTPADADARAGNPTAGHTGRAATPPRRTLPTVGKTEWKILRALRDRKCGRPMLIVAVGAATGLGDTACRQNVKLLARKGLVTRAGRNSGVSLTDDGRAVPAPVRP